MLYKDSLLPFTEEKGSCTAIVKGNAVNVADGKGMQVPCTLHFKGCNKIYLCIATTASEKQLNKGTFVL